MKMHSYGKVHLYFFIKWELKFTFKTHSVRIYICLFSQSSYFMFDVFYLGVGQGIFIFISLIRGKVKWMIDKNTKLLTHFCSSFIELTQKHLSRHSQNSRNVDGVGIRIHTAISLSQSLFLGGGFKVKIFNMIYRSDFCNVLGTTSLNYR